MKKFFSIALVAALIAGTSAACAQTPSTSTSTPTEQCDRAGKCDRPGKKDRADKMGKKDGAHKHNKKDQRPNLLAGITLTPEQQSKVDALKSERKAQRKGEPRAENGENAKMTKEDREARRQAYDAKLKAILTPDQWSVYQKNVEDMKAKRKNKNKNQNS